MRNDFERAIASQAAAKSDVSAPHPDTRTFRGQSAHCRIERNLSRSSNDVWMVASASLLPCCRFDVARGGNRSMAHSSAAIHLNLNLRAQNFSYVAPKRISRIKNAAIYAKRLTCRTCSYGISKDLAGFAAANGHDGKERQRNSRRQREFLKHISHPIICIGASDGVRSTE